jgi:hypothetical protein
VQRADAQFLVSGEGDVVLPSFERGGQAYMASGLAGDLVAVRSEEGSELLTVQVAWKLHAGMTSSFTR